MMEGVVVEAAVSTAGKRMAVFVVVQCLHHRCAQKRERGQCGFELAEATATRVEDGSGSGGGSTV